MTEDRFILQRSTQYDNRWVLTDKENGIVITFEQGKFNDTQKVTYLPDNLPGSTPQEAASDIARALQEMGQYMYDYHYNIAMPFNAKWWRKYIGSRINGERKAKGISTEELADLCGVKPITITNIEYGKFSAPLELLTTIAHQLGMKLELINYED